MEWLFAVPVVGGGYFAALALLRRKARALGPAATEMLSQLRQIGRVETLRPFSTRHLPLSLEFLAIAPFVASMICACFLFGSVVGILGTVVALGLGCQALLNVSTAGTWRGELLLGEAFRTQILFVPVFWLLFLVGVCAILDVEARHTAPERLPVTETIQRVGAVASRWICDPTWVSDTPDSYREETLDSLARAGASSGNPAELASRVVVVTYFFPTLLFLVMALRNWRTIRDNWSLASGGDSPEGRTFPEAELLGNGTKLLVVLNGLIQAVIHLLALVVAIDSGAYVCTGVSLHFGTGHAYALATGIVDLGFGSSVAGVLAAIVSAILVVPGVLVAWALCWRLFHLARSRAGPAARHEHGHDIVTTDCAPLPIYSQAGWRWHPWTPVIIEERSLQKRLSKEEHDALLAHESYHCTHDARRVLTLQVLSLVLLQPSGYCLLLHEFARQEFAADAFAKERVGAAPLESALAKLTVLYQSEPLRMSQVVAPFSPWFSRGLFGANYPFLRERLAVIRERQCPH